MSYLARLRQLAAPLLLIVIIGLVGNIVSDSTQTEVIGVLVNMTIVISLYVFIGNSGIISFGQISFVAIGFANSLLGAVLPSSQRVFLPSAVFLLVIVVLLIRPEGLFASKRHSAVDRV